MTPPARERRVNLTLRRESRLRLSWLKVLCNKQENADAESSKCDVGSDPAFAGAKRLRSVLSESPSSCAAKALAQVGSRSPVGEQTRETSL